MTDVASPGNDRSTHHLILTNSATSVSLILCNSDGEENELAFQPTPLPTQSLKMYSGEQTYSDMEPPWTPVAQTDWSGGRGAKDFDNDTSMYYDGSSVNTCRPGEVILGPKATENLYAGSASYGNTNSGNVAQYNPGNPAIGGYLCYAFKFTAGATVTVVRVDVDLKIPSSVTTGGLFYVGLATKKAVTFDPENAAYSSNCITVGTGAFGTYSFTVSKQINSGTDYYLLFKFQVPSTATSCFTHTSTTAAGLYWTSTTGADGSWTAGADKICPFFTAYAAQVNTRMHCFEYKGALYGVTNPDDATYSKLYLNGDQGVCETTDTTATNIITHHGINQWAEHTAEGSIMKLISGTGADQPQNWSIITHNTAVGVPGAGQTTFTVSPGFDVKPDDTTVYVIVASDYWTEIAGFFASYATSKVTDVLAVNGSMYFARGDGTAIARVNGYNVAGHWTYTYSGVTADVAAETMAVTYLAYASDQIGNFILGAKAGFPACVYRAAAKDATAWAGTDTLSPGVVMSPGSAINVGDIQERITGLQVYGAYGNVHVFKEGSIHELIDGKPYKLGIAEMENTRDPRNGLAHCQHGVYLYMSWYNTMLRYYNGMLDRIGPEKAEVAIPTSDRAGNFTSIVGYPGLVIGSMDAGKSGTSSVLAFNGSGWCELYRATVGYRIQGLYVQAIPGNAVDRLWVCVGPSLVWLPMSIDPFNHPADTYNPYHYSTTGELITAWYYVQLHQVDKLFNSIRAVIENATATYYTEVAFQVDEETAWTTLVEHTTLTDFTAFASEKDLDTTPSISGKRIRFKFTLHTDATAHTTPRIVATILEALTTLPVKYSVVVTARLYDERGDLQGNAESVPEAITRYNTLVSLQALATPCLASATNTLMNGKYYKLDSVTPVPRAVNSTTVNESYLVQFRMTEV